MADSSAAMPGLGESSPPKSVYARNIQEIISVESPLEPKMATDHVPHRHDPEKLPNVSGPMSS